MTEHMGRMRAAIIAEDLDHRKILFFVPGAFVALAFLSYLALDLGYEMLVASFGASAAILFGTPGSRFARPRNVIAGHVMSAIIAVALYGILGCTWYSIALGVSVAITAMLLTDTFHPPGGATVIVCMMSEPDWGFVLMPIALGAVVLTAVAETDLRLYRRYAGSKAAAL